MILRVDELLIVSKKLALRTNRTKSATLMKYNQGEMLIEII